MISTARCNPHVLGIGDRKQQIVVVEGATYGPYCVVPLRWSLYNCMYVFIPDNREILIPTLRDVKAGEAAFSPAEYDTGYTIRLTLQWPPGYITSSISHYHTDISYCSQRYGRSHSCSLRVWMTCLVTRWLRHTHNCREQRHA